MSKPTLHSGLWGLTTYLVVQTVWEYDPDITMTDIRSLEIDMSDPQLQWPCLSISFYDKTGYKHIDEFPKDLTVFGFEGHGKCCCLCKTTE